MVHNEQTLSAISGMKKLLEHSMKKCRRRPAKVNLAFKKLSKGKAIDYMSNGRAMIINSIGGLL